MSESVISTKIALRKLYIAKRKNVSQLYRFWASKKVIELYMQHFCKAKHVIQIIAGYNPHCGELNIKPLLNALSSIDYNIVVVLGFTREYKLFDFNSGVEVDVHPTIFLTPLICFNSSGYRLGFGGGFYDKIISNSGLNTRFIGFSYEMQKCESIPIEQHDMPLDCVITERKVRFF